MSKLFSIVCLLIIVTSSIYMLADVTKADETPLDTVTKIDEIVTDDIEVDNVPLYNTQREEYLFTKVQKTVDLPGFGDYQDLLASYAYNTCKRKMGDVKGTYSCENLVLTWNSENGGWNYKTFNHGNSNGTSDGGLCQLNSSYHKPFIDSEHFNNPLSQLDYCLGVWQDAQRKGTMPRYGFYPRHKRNRGIAFNVTESVTAHVGQVTVKPQTLIYPKARQVQDEADRLWAECKKIGECQH